MVVAAIFSTVGSGLVYSWHLSSNSGMWIKYQVICGIGEGLGLQIPVIVSQAVIDKEDLSIISAMAIFFQLLGDAIWISTTQSIFENELIQDLTTKLGATSASRIVAAGATGLRGQLSPSEKLSVVSAYTSGLRKTYALYTALAGAAAMFAFASLFLDRRKLNPALPKKTDRDADDGSKDESKAEDEAKSESEARAGSEAKAE